jgi:hypothetical protein
MGNLKAFLIVGVLVCGSTACELETETASGHFTSEAPVPDEELTLDFGDTEIVYSPGLSFPFASYAAEWAVTVSVVSGPAEVVDNAGLTSLLINGPGTIELQARDAWGRTADGSLVVLPPLTVSPATQNVSFSGEGYRTTVSPTGGQLPHRFRVSSGPGTINDDGEFELLRASQLDSQATTVVQVSSADGSSEEVTLYLLSDLVFTADKVETVCSPQASSAVNFTISGGSPPYRIEQNGSDIGGTQFMTSNLSYCGTTGGSYGPVRTFTAFDSAGRSASVQVTIHRPSHFVTDSRFRPVIGGAPLRVPFIDRFGQEEFVITRGGGSIDVNTGVYTSPATVPEPYSSRQEVSFRLDDGFGNSSEMSYLLYIPPTFSPSTVNIAAGNPTSSSVRGNGNSFTIRSISNPIITASLSGRTLNLNPDTEVTEMTPVEVVVEDDRGYSGILNVNVYPRMVVTMAEVDKDFYARYGDRVVPLQISGGVPPYRKVLYPEIGSTPLYDQTSEKTDTEVVFDQAPFHHSTPTVDLNLRVFDSGQSVSLFEQAIVLRTGAFGVGAGETEIPADVRDITSVTGHQIIDHQTQKIHIAYTRPGSVQCYGQFTTGPWAVPNRHECSEYNPAIVGARREIASFSGKLGESLLSPVMGIGPLTSEGNSEANHIHLQDLPSPSDPWRTSFGPSASDQVLEVVPSSDGDSFVAGGSTFVDSSGSATTGANAFITHVTRPSTVDWQLIFDDTFSVLAIEPSGSNFLVFGMGLDRRFILRTVDASGIVTSTLRLSSPSFESLESFASFGARDMTVDAEGNIYVVAGRPGSSSPGSTGESVIVKFDSAGNELWSVNYEFGLFKRIVVGIQGIYVAGVMYNLPDYTEPSAPERNTGIIGRITPEGRFLYERRFGLGHLFGGSVDLADFITVGDRIWVVGSAESRHGSTYSYKGFVQQFWDREEL